MFYIAVVVFVSRAAPGEVYGVALDHRSTGLLINALPVSEWIPLRPMGREVMALSRAWMTPVEALFMRAKWTVRPVFTSVMVRA